jgi:hypothetical protein
LIWRSHYHPPYNIGGDSKLFDNLRHSHCRGIGRYALVPICVRSSVNPDRRTVAREFIGSGRECDEARRSASRPIRYNRSDFGVPDGIGKLCAFKQIPSQRIEPNS